MCLQLDGRQHAGHNARQAKRKASRGEGGSRSSEGDEGRRAEQRGGERKAREKSNGSRREVEMAQRVDAVPVVYICRCLVA